MRNKILQGHVLDQLDLIPENHIDTIITSPPYWGLRDYETELVWFDEIDPNCPHKYITEEIIKSNPSNDKSNLHEWKGDGRDRKLGPKDLITTQETKGQSGGTKSSKVKVKGKDNFQIVNKKTFATCNNCGAWYGQLGLEPHFYLYIKHLVDIFEKCKRVLKPTGALFVNLGDTYFGGGQAQGHKEDTKNLGSNTANKSYVTIPIARGDMGIKNKSLVGIPQRFMIAMIDKGWICRNNINWNKGNAMPTSAKDRFTVDFEPIYFFTQEEKYYFNQQFEKVGPLNRWGGNKLKGKEKNKYQSSRGNRESRPYGENVRNMRTTWKINTVGYSGAHFAVFPNELVEIPIEATTPKIHDDGSRGIVLDIFFGRGTTGKVARELGRDYLGIELNQKYIDLANKYLNKTKRLEDLL